MLQISLYFKYTSSFSILNDMLFPLFSKYLIYSLICRKITHKGLITPSLCKLPIKYLDVSLLFLTLLEMIILFTLTKFKGTAFLEA